MFSKLKPLPDGVFIGPADWSADAGAIAVIRRAVFIDEQSVPEELEWEEIDPRCRWFLARHRDTPIAIVRLTPGGRIGRMAVLPAWRGRGIGSHLLAATLAAARQNGLPTVELHAQNHAIGFYERFGFAVVGPEFAEAGIPHRHMILTLGDI